MLELYKLAARLRKLNKFFKPKKRRIKKKSDCILALVQQEMVPLPTDLEKAAPALPLATSQVEIAAGQEKKTISLEKRRATLEKKGAEIDTYFKGLGTTWIDALNAPDEAFKTNGSKFQNFAIISYDEKPGVQAISNTAPDLPPVLNKYSFQSRDHEYKRLGIVDILAGINLITGHVHACIAATHKSSDFIEWLQTVDSFYPKELKIVILLENLSSHISQETREWLDEKQGRFEFVFTPKHASWLNEIESFFSSMARSVLRGIRVKNIKEMTSRLLQYISINNNNPTVYEWTYGLD